MDSKWSMFIIAVGFLIIATAPTTNNQLISIVSGIFIIGIGFIQSKRNKKK